MDDLKGLKVDTLAVFTTNRGPYIIQDQVDAIAWSFDRPHLAVCVVDRPPGTPVERGHGHVLVPSSLPGGRFMSGFKNQEGIRWALEAGVDFRVAMCLDDDALPIGRGLDAWALDEMSATAIDLLGVRDRVSYQRHWKDAIAALGRWMPEAKRITGAIDLLAESVFYAANWMSRELAEQMRSRGLLVPDGCERWQNWPDVYVSWVAQLLGAYQVCWGGMDNPVPPLYANHRNHMRFAPDPRILHPDFKIYHPVRYVTYHDERTIRRHYETIRRTGAVPGWPALAAARPSQEPPPASPAHRAAPRSQAGPGHPGA